MAEQTKDECVQNAKLAEQAERYVTIYHATFALVYLYFMFATTTTTTKLMVFSPLDPLSKKTHRSLSFPLSHPPSMYLLTKGIA